MQVASSRIGLGGGLLIGGGGWLLEDGFERIPSGRKKGLGSAVSQVTMSKG